MIGCLLLVWTRKALRNAARGHVPTPLTRSLVDVRHEGTVDQTQCFVPIGDQEGQREQIEFGVGVREQSAARALNCAQRGEIHQFAFGTEDTAEEEFDLDAAVGPSFQFLFEELHRLSTQRADGLLLRVRKDVLVRGPRTREATQQQQLNESEL